MKAISSGDLENLVFQSVVNWSGDSVVAPPVTECEPVNYRDTESPNEGKQSPRDRCDAPNATPVHFSSSIPKTNSTASATATTATAIQPTGAAVPGLSILAVAVAGGSGSFSMRVSPKKKVTRPEVSSGWSAGSTKAGTVS